MKCINGLLKRFPVHVIHMKTWMLLANDTLHGVSSPGVHKVMTIEVLRPPVIDTLNFGKKAPMPIQHCSASVKCDRFVGRIQTLSPLALVHR
jgi:hypothetical protein